MFDPKQTTPPEIWKAVYSVSDVNDNRQILDRYLSIADKMQFPFDFSPATVSYNLGIGADLESIDNGRKLLVRGVVPGGRADELGLRPGDVITKINGKNKFKLKILFSHGSDLVFKVVDLGDLFSATVAGASMLKTVNVAKIYLDRGDKSAIRWYWPELNRNQDEYTIERDGKKVKLIGKLYDPNAANVVYARFWDIIDNNYIYYIDTTGARK